MRYTIQNDTQKHTSKERDAFLCRVANITGEIVETLANKKRLSSALNLTDIELIRLMFETQIERTSEVSPRELRKIAILNEGAIQFAEHLKGLGGTCRASRAAEILGVKRQTINNRVKAGKLLAIKSGGESLIPLFQFDGNKVVAGLEEVLAKLVVFSDVTKISFLTTLFFFNDEPELNVVDVLKKYGKSEKYMDVITCQASLFGSQAAH
ncbi:helix-turn-helix domain-containing protein [Rouxiella sp. T17]|uniref:helix-turn-helix domain-containing protein n=1 Tax=Rouxiella sp. T17 TaxID=3085684 RepID=UPI002FC8B7AB